MDHAGARTRDVSTTLLEHKLVKFSRENVLYRARASMLAFGMMLMFAILTILSTQTGEIFATLNDLPPEAKFTALLVEKLPSILLGLTAIGFGIVFWMTLFDPLEKRKEAEK